MTNGRAVTASDVELYGPMFKSLGRRCASSYPGIEAEDVEQEIWVELIPHWGKLAGDDALMRAAAERVGRRYCIKERYTYVFGTGEYVYTPAEVRGLLREGFFNEAAREMLPTGHDVLIEGGGVACGLWDLDQVYQRLSDAQRSVIERRYLFGETLTDADDKRLSRAIEAATRLLNWKTEVKRTVTEAYAVPAAMLR